MDFDGDVLGCGVKEERRRKGTLRLRMGGRRWGQRTRETHVA